METIFNFILGFMAITLGMVGYIFYLAFMVFIIGGCCFLAIRGVVSLLGWKEVDDS